MGAGGMGGGSRRGESGESLSSGTCKNNACDKYVKFYGLYRSEKRRVLYIKIFFITTFLCLAAVSV